MKKPLTRSLVTLLSVCMVIVSMPVFALAKTDIPTIPLQFSLAKPINHYVNQNYLFGELLSGTSSQYHEGVDYSVSNDNTVSASYPGTVKFIRRDMPNSKDQTFSYGNCVITETYVGGYYHYIIYAHLKTVASDINEGTYVIAGRTLGKSGQSGNVTGPHLHFTVARNASAQTFKTNGQSYAQINTTLLNFFYNNNNARNPERYLQNESGRGVVMGRGLSSGSNTTSGKNALSGLRKTGVGITATIAELYHSTRSLTDSTAERWLAKDVVAGNYTVTNGSNVLYIPVVANSVTYADFDVSRTASDFKEFNNTMAEAQSRGVMQNAISISNGYIQNSKDVDYYYIRTPSTKKTMTVTLNNMREDFDLFLLNSSGSTIASSTNSSTTQDRIIQQNVAANTYLYVRVQGKSGKYDVSYPYSLSVTYS